MSLKGNINCYGPPYVAASLLSKKIIDMIVRLTEAGYEPQYLPQATEEDRGAQPCEKHKLELARSPS